MPSLLKTVVQSILWVAILPSASRAGCPNLCSGHGICNRADTVCTCLQGWTGGDCSQRMCPIGRAWADEATATDTAHAPVPCSNRGRCDPIIGQCICQLGYEGHACERMSCPSDCNGRGRCVSMEELASSSNLNHAPSAPVPAVTRLPYTAPWDARKVYGCQCDEGFAGFDCSQRQCPVGDDPLTAGQVNELQLVKCTAASGSFTLAYKGQYTEPIPVSASATAMRQLLLPILDVSIVFLGGGSAVCDSKGSQVVSLEFKQRFGAQPSLVAGGEQRSLVAIAAHGASIMGSSKPYLSVTGTKESITCSGRGTCDVLTGTCSCYTGYTTSDGYGKPGARGDCGAPTGGITACPGQGLACSGHGVCSNSPQYKCMCASGWTGGDCAERTCLSGKAWLDAPTTTANKAHHDAVCSNRGICDTVKGSCTCGEGFTGGACERMTCPGYVDGTVTCSGHGACLSMAQLATRSDVHSGGAQTAYTYGAIPNDPLHWDFNQAFGCKCDAGYTGYDCSQRQCPRGDDPKTGGQHFETQVVKCVADGGTFALQFRGLKTDPIAWDATPAAVGAALTALDSVGKVTVTFSGGAGAVACAATTTITDTKISVTFNTALGDVPRMVADGALLTWTGGKTSTLAVFADGEVADGVVPSVRGTKENAVCSNRGICSTTTGLCQCFTGYGSSDGSGNVGERGDCGYIRPVIGNLFPALPAV